MKSQGKNNTSLISQGNSRAVALVGEHRVVAVTSGKNEKGVRLFERPEGQIIGYKYDSRLELIKITDYLPANTLVSKD